MNKFVFNIFKTLLFSIIFIFVVDMVFYMYRALSLNQKMNSIMTSMQKVVMENNYLTERDATTYTAIFNQLIDDYNGRGNGYAGARTGEERTATWSEDGGFINSIRWNYGTDAAIPNIDRSDFVTKDYTRSDSAISNRNILKTDMKDTTANYGDVMVVQVQVDMVSPLYEFLNPSYRYDPDDVLNRQNVINTVTYTYLVPCQHYQVMNEN